MWSRSANAPVMCGMLLTRPMPKGFTKAQKLAKALKACRKRTRPKRAACERKARKRYTRPPPGSRDSTEWPRPRGWDSAAGEALSTRYVVDTRGGHVLNGPSSSGHRRARAVVRRCPARNRCPRAARLCGSERRRNPPIDTDQG